jgi:hypothetical protein
MNRNNGQQVLDACPSIDELNEFSVGRLPEPALNRIAAHIEAPCPRCVAALAELEDSPDPLLADLREPLPLSTAETDEVCRRVLKRTPAPAAYWAETMENPRITTSVAPAGDEVPPDLPGYVTSTPWIDKGVMGVVWHVRDLQFRRPLAVKVMMAAWIADTHRIRRFFDEARITAQLAHPSIVPVHAMGRLADGRPYYTMKLVEGNTLAELLKVGSDAASPRMDLLPVFARVCQALAFMHSKGVIHRDLKPSNVMVGKYGEVQVMDFGVAKVLAECDVLPTAEVQTGVTLDKSDDHTQPGALMGTLEYMSTEQANGRIEEVDRRSDVFGLGAMLCAILTGKPPYVGRTKSDVLRAAKEADLAGAYERLESSGADPELIALARACLYAEPKDRPKDASAVEERLTDYLASVEQRLRHAERERAAAQARAEQASLTQQEAEKARRRTLWLAVGLGITLMALVAAGRFANLAQQAELRTLAAVRDRLAAVQDRLAAVKAHEEEMRQHAIDTALTAAMGGDLDAAEQAITVAEGAGASTGQVQMLRGQVALHRGQSQEARRHLEQAVWLLPKSVAARGMLAAAYASDGQWEWYDKAVREMAELIPSTPEDFLFKGYAEANLEPTRGLETIKQAFDRRPMMGIALLLRSYVRAYVAQDTDDPKVAEEAVQDARYAREFLRDNPAALWVSLNAHMAKAGVHEHRDQPDQRRAEMELAGKDADALRPFTALPEAVVYRWLYFREMRREEEVLEELRLASERTDHVYVTFCYAQTLYRRGRPGDLEEALRLLQTRPGTYNDRLLPFLLAEHDYPAKHAWPARALKACEDFAARVEDGVAVMDAQAVMYLLGKKGDAIEASKALLKQPERFYSLRREPILQCLRYNAGALSEDDLIRGAEHSRWDQCLAHYFVAMTKLAEGDRKGAQEHFDKVINSRAYFWGIYDSSWVYRARLAKDPNWPPWISKGQVKSVLSAILFNLMRPSSVGARRRPGFRRR